MSAVQVFDSIGIYTVLLIVQRRRNRNISNHRATIARVAESAGAALQACLEEREVSNPDYKVFQVEQDYFDQREWSIVSPDQIRIVRRIALLPKLTQFMDVAQGFVTGQDKVFIRPKEIVPRGEERVYIDYLQDRQIGRYILPRKADYVVFYPFREGIPLEEDELRTRFPRTWDYLNDNKAALQSRKSLVESGAWWRPTRPRARRILLAKIVCPHLMLTPRFAVNHAGNFGVSHGPFIVAKDLGEERILLDFFCAVLNSTACNWYLRTSVPKYGRGYSRLEVSSLRDLPVPDINRIDNACIRSVTEKVQEITKKYSYSLDDEIDREISELYGFSPSERTELLRL